MIRIGTKLRVAGVLAACLLVAGLPVAGAQCEELPQRKAGLWEMTTTMDEGGGPIEQVLTMCIDADMERNTVQASLAEHKNSCSRYDISRSGDKTVVDMECEFSKATVSGKTEMSGDFQRSFQVSIESTTARTGDNAQTVTIARSIKQAGRYVGHSCGELKPGEAQAPDGTKILVQ